MSEPHSPTDFRGWIRYGIWSGLTVSVMALILWANLRTTQKVVFVQYNAADFFEYGERSTRGWPFSRTSFEPESKQWVIHPLRTIADVGIASILVAGAFQGAKVLGRHVFR